MSYLRSPEIKKALFIQILLSAFCIFATHLFCGSRSAFCSAFICLLFIILYLIENQLRYSRIAAISGQIDQILHGEKINIMQDCKEGDISILAVQVNKIVRKLQEQADKLSADKILMTDYMADISHQIKTPLTSIRLILTLLQGEDLSQSKRLELVQELSGLANRVEWLVYALLLMSKLDAGTITLKQENILIEDLIKHAYATLAIPLELRNIRFCCEIDSSISMIGDMAWMTEAIENVLKNCMEHTPENGEIRVSASETPLFTRIHIEDTGKGIDAEDLPHIFERFYRGKHSDSQSVGIGLALSKRIIVSQNGAIQAGNRHDGTGAFFDIRIYKSII